MRRGVRRAVVPALWLAAGLSLAAAPGQAAQQLTRPDVNFSNPAIPSAPTSRLKPMPTITMKPLITGYGPGACVAIGGPITVLGKYLAGPDGKSVVLAGHGLHVVLGVVAWGDNKIVATIPKDPQIDADQTYYIGIQKTGQAGWLSNTDKTFTTCTTALSARTPLSTAGTGFAPRQVAPSAPAAEPAPSAAYGAGATGASLLARGLPPPPAAPAPTARESQQDSPDVEPGELVVVSANLDEAQALAGQAGGLGYSVKRRRVLKGLGLIVTVLRLPAGTPVAQARQNLRAAAPKVWIDANHRYRLQGADAAKVYGRALVHGGTPSASCGAGRRIGLVDTRVDLAQPALRGQAVTVHDVLPAGVARAAADHGTAVAALLVGRPRPAATAGLVSGAHLYAAAVFRRRGERLDTTAEDVVAALDWLVRRHVQVINLSLGGPRNLILEAAVRRVEDLGIAVVAAAGNGGPGGAPLYPAAQPGVVAVTAVDADLKAYEHANRGAYVAFAAPGVDVWVARPGRGGAFVSGTSYAAPFVTAAIARVGGRPEAAVRALARGARDLGKPGRDPVFGWGVIRLGGHCGR